jgi:signal transduction histidine kinase
MPSAKSRRIETTDQATAKLTLPLKYKLSLVFGGFAMLFILSAGLLSWLIFRADTQSEQAILYQVRLQRITQLQFAFAGEQAAIGRLLAYNLTDEKSRNEINDFELQLYQITFENNLALLRRDPPAKEIGEILLDLGLRHTNLNANFVEIIAELKLGNNAKAKRQWEDNAPLIQDLTARLTTFAEQQGYLAEFTGAATAQNQVANIVWVALIISSEALLLIILIWLANRNVIAPLDRLNIKLGQLLYGQTVRITDRLNLLEHEIDNQLQKVTAVRHDLKIPLSNIRNEAEIILDGEPQLAEPIKTGLNDIIEIVDISSRQISGLLAHSNNHLQLVKTDLQVLVQRVVELVDLRDYKVHLKVELQESMVDPDLLEHTLLNLLSNAHKFSAGGIAIGTRLAPVQWGVKQEAARTTRNLEKTAEAEIWVWNDGPVISLSDRELIFRPGGQTELGRQAGGHGLGLAIVKSLVERHGGRIVLESHEKVGTTFRVFLPYYSILGGDEAVPGSNQ